MRGYRTEGRGGLIWLIILLVLLALLYFYRYQIIEYLKTVNLPFK